METTIYLDKRSQKKNGKYPVKLRLQFKGKQIYFLTGIDVELNNFKDGTAIGSDKKYQPVIYAKKLRFDSRILDLERCNKLKEFDCKQLKTYLESDGIEIKEQSGLYFKPYLLSFIEKYSNKSTKNTFRDMQKKVSTFCDIDELTFENINVAWLKDFDIFMEKGNIKINTRGIYMRNIRVLYNDAIDRELIPLNLYPFRRFKIKKGETRHKDMPVSDLKKLIDYDTSEMPAMQR
ncbi:MAG: phage integrase SAM-like domain-containing protein [Paludibacter sp.]|nr:phage integrase SAM-like domain-containing protein [Paludibacter sp.]